LSPRVLDPLERSSEILFGLIMVLTFTGSISVAESGHEETRAVLIGAIGCNLAWGLVDAVMYLSSSFLTRGRNLATYRAVRESRDTETAHRLILGALPPVVAQELTPEEVESVRQRLIRQQEPSLKIRVGGKDVAGALGVFLLVFLSTFPVVIPFLIVPEAGKALRTSNAVAVLMLFATGWSLGKYASRSPWWTGFAAVSIGIVLVAITMALGG
jgi:hypothetical protein